MSGGHFEYKQYILNDIAEELESVIKNNKIKDEYEYMTDYPDEVLEKFEECRKSLVIVSNMVQRIDWLLSGDDGIDCFHKRWIEDVDSLNTKESVIINNDTGELNEI